MVCRSAPSWLDGPQGHLRSRVKASFSCLVGLPSAGLRTPKKPLRSRKIWLPGGLARATAPILSATKPQTERRILKIKGCLKHGFSQHSTALQSAKTAKNPRSPLRIYTHVASFHSFSPKMGSSTVGCPPPGAEKSCPDSSGGAGAFSDFGDGAKLGKTVF